MPPPPQPSSLVLLPMCNDFIHTTLYTHTLYTLACSFWQPNLATVEQWSTITNGDGTLNVQPWEEGTLCILSGCYESQDMGYPKYGIPNTTCTRHTSERLMKLLYSFPTYFSITIIARWYCIMGDSTRQSSFSLVTFTIDMQVGGHYSSFTLYLLPPGLAANWWMLYTCTAGLSSLSTDSYYLQNMGT